MEYLYTKTSWTKTKHLFFKHLLNSALLFLNLCFLTSSLSAQEVTRGPYLQMLGSKTVTIRWRTTVETTSKVSYGFNNCSLDQRTIQNEETTEHEITLSNLVPNQKYFYSIGTVDKIFAGGDEQHFFKTSPLGAMEETINIWVLGDAGTGGFNQRKVRDAFYEFQDNEPLDMILLLGDNAYPSGTDDEFQDSMFEDMYEDKLINTPTFSTYGNHDAIAADNEDESGPYFDIFNFPKKGELGGIPSGHEGFYSFDYGDIHIISINDYDEDMSVDEEQFQWLKADLEANDKGWLIVLLHFPPYGGSNNISDIDVHSTELRATHLPLFEAHGVDLVLGGHSHHYQRSYLLANHYGYSYDFLPDEHVMDMGDGQLDGDGAYQKKVDNKGTVYLTTGSAAALFGINDDLDYPAMYANHLNYGSVRLQVKHDQLDASFITEEGIIMDYFTIQKELAPVKADNFDITDSDFLVYPNPAQDFLNLVFKAADEDGDVELEITDVNGRTKYKKDCHVNKGDIRLRINDLKLNSGVYFIRMKIMGDLLSKQFVILD